MKARPSSHDRFVIIMAGGRGERFWPVSRQARPKQLLSLLGKRSFLQQAVDRVLPLVPLNNIIVITNEAQVAEVKKQLPKLPKANLIAEPCGRDTCAAVTLGGTWVQADLSKVDEVGVFDILPGSGAWSAPGQPVEKQPAPPAGGWIAVSSFELWGQPVSRK